MVKRNNIFNRVSIFILLSAYLSMLFAGVSHIDCNHNCKSHSIVSEISSQGNSSDNFNHLLKSYTLSIEEKESFCFFCTNGSNFSSTINSTLNYLNVCLFSLNLINYHPIIKSSSNYVISIPRAPPTFLFS
ncbi:MAG: hypothetical protein IPP08_02015 [Chlorobiota bacterium]|nr:hypothetical protein [Chlorobiota bacterium]QQS66971.1 MAG: hypothetical protein IPP08_02015 [Chlorobiota bacterium]